MGSALYLYTMNIKQLKAANLRRLREQAGMKQWQIEEMIGAKESHISEMESGKRAISDRVISILQDKLNIRPYEFFINNETPILKDGEESRHISDYREAEKLMIADKVDSYMSFIIKEKQREKKEETDIEKMSENN